MFDWPSFLKSRAIPFVTSGPNVAKGAIAIRCPWCGPADPSEHLVIRLNGKGWWCWRNKTHRGGSPVRIVATLLGCSFEQAAQITGTERYLPPADFLGSVEKLLYPTKAKEEKRRALELPEEFRPLYAGRMRHLYRSYLKEERGFYETEVEHISDDYHLRYCTRGAYARRIIFPVYFMGELVGWTGRAIDRSAYIRYKTLSQDKEKADREGYPPAKGMINDYLLWYDDLIEETEEDGTLSLLICEGPMDGLKVNVLGRSRGIRATCIFTSAPTPSQIDLLYTLVPRFKDAYIFLDRGMLHQALAIQAELRALDLGVVKPPKGLDDPAELSDLRDLNLT